MYVNDYLQEKFPQLKLRPPLFYNWDIGIRFELGIDYNSDNIYANCPYLIKVYNRAVTLFNTLHASEDDIFIVVDVHDFAVGEVFKRKLNLFSKYVKEKSVLINVKQRTIPFVFPDDNKDRIYKTHRFTLSCKISDLHYVPLLKAICNQDMGLKPSISHDVYFINRHRNTIFHVYDDRGCDVVATSPESIRDVYESYTNWILEYDREQIDRVFKVGR